MLSKNNFNGIEYTDLRTGEKTVVIYQNHDQIELGMRKARCFAILYTDAKPVRVGSSENE